MRRRELSWRLAVPMGMRSPYVWLFVPFAFACAHEVKPPRLDRFARAQLASEPRPTASVPQHGEPLFQARAPHEGAVTIDGPLPEAVIKRIVRQSLGRARRCYEEGVRAHGLSAGTVAVHFVTSA